MDHGTHAISLLTPASTIYRQLISELLQQPVFWFLLLKKGYSECYVCNKGKDAQIADSISYFLAFTRRFWSLVFHQSRHLSFSVATVTICLLHQSTKTFFISPSIVLRRDGRLNNSTRWSINPNKYSIGFIISVSYLVTNSETLGGSKTWCQNHHLLLLIVSIFEILLLQTPKGQSRTLC